MTIPPFFDPPNPRIDPLILRELGLLGYKMAADLQRAGQGGVTTNATYDTWWHGGFRSAPYYHNSIGILSEAASADLMTPVTITKENLSRRNPTRGIASMLETATNIPDPWEGGEWKPSDIARVEMIASRAVLEMAAKFRANYLQNFYNLSKANLTQKPDEPQAFVITAGQPNQETVARLLEILMWQGMEIHRMTDEGYFAMEEKKRNDFHEMPLGSFLVFVNQPQKNNVLSLFEKQVYPNRLNANGEAEVPYDVAGWTLPLQMGVEADAIWNIKDLDKFQNTLKRVENINQAREVLNLKPTQSAVCKTAESFKDKSEYRTLQRQYRFDGRRLDAARFGQFSDSFHVACGRKFSSKSFKLRRDNSAFDERTQHRARFIRKTITRKKFPAASQNKALKI